MTSELCCSSTRIDLVLNNPQRLKKPNQSGLQDSSKYLSQFQKWCDQDYLDLPLISSSPQPFFQTFRFRSMGTMGITVTFMFLSLFSSSHSFIIRS